MKNKKRVVDAHRAQKSYYFRGQAPLFCQGLDELALYTQLNRRSEYASNTPLQWLRRFLCHFTMSRRQVSYFSSLKIFKSKGRQNDECLSMRNNTTWKVLCSDGFTGNKNPKFLSYFTAERQKCRVSNVSLSIQ